MKDRIAFLAVQAALYAGEILKRGFGTQFDIAFKSGAHNLVTQYDHAAEKAIIDMIRHEFPHHSFLAEESGSTKQAKESAVHWLIDPLDGTLNFANNIPLFSVSIAAMIDNILTVGVVYAPMTNELFVAVKGQGAFLNGKKIQVSPKKDFKQAMGVTGFPYHIEDHPNNYIQRFIRIMKEGNPVRDLGSAAINLAYVAAGRFDMYWIDSLQPWDIAAGQLLVEEAGGKVTHYDGNAIQIKPEANLLATNTVFHEQMLKFLKI